MNFYGSTYDALWVNNNGNVTFDAPLGTYTPFGLSATRTPIIAPFFADVDTRGTGTDPVAYGYGETTFEGHAAFCVSWVNVGYFSGKADKTNSFQLLLVSRPDAGTGAFDIVFNYGRVQWETGDASDGMDGLGGSSARVGFSSGTGIPGSYSELPGSGTNGSFLDTSPVGLVYSSLGSSTLGRYTFPVRSDGQVADRYVAMGDSYQSGEGAYSYESGTDNGTNKCHRSANAYPNLLVDRQVVRLQLDFVACSGAVIHDLIYSSEEDGAPLEGEAAQVDSLGTDTRLVTVGIGGNDLDFGGTIKSCVESGIKSWIPIVNWFNYSCIGNQGDEVEANLADLETGQVGEDLLDLYRLIRAKAPYARIEVVSYPRFFPADAADNLLGCASIARKADQKWINAGIVRANSAIERIASLAGVGSINMSDVLEGHELCDPEPAMNGVVDPFSPESYHPNVLGHSLMADRIEQELSTTIEPTYQIRPQETVQRVFTVQGKRFTVNVAWPGSDVKTTLTSPSGQVFSRSSHNGATHDNGPTYEYYDINSPEPGQWTVTSFGKDVSPAGEPVTLSMYDMPELNRVPKAVVTTTGSGPSFTFDGTTSVDPDGTITNYLWDFGDGTSAVGAIVEHTYGQSGQYLVALVTTDDDGAEGFGSASSVIDTTRSLPAVSVKSPLTLTNSFTTTGPNGDVRVVGDFSCNSTVRISGDVVATGNAYFTNNCRIDGDVTVGGNALFNSTPSVGGNVVVTGKVSYQSTARILGNLTSGGPLTVIDGKSTTQLASLGSIGGQITSYTTVPPVVVDDYAFVYNPTEWIDPVNTTWRQWMNATATSNNAPTWSRGLSANPGCTLSPGGDSVNGKIVTLSTPTLVDARRSVNGCSAVTVQNMEIAMSSDLTFIADKIGIVNGLKVTSADGKAHVLRLIATGSATSCTSTNGISASGGLNIDPKISTQVLAAGQAKIDGPASFSGQVLAACFASSGATNIAYANVVTPGLVVTQ